MSRSTACCSRRARERDGFIGLKDFRGDLIRAFQAKGVHFHAETVIWKDPVTQMQRTKALGLLHKSVRENASMCRQGIPDYLVTMRAPRDVAERVKHTAEIIRSRHWQRVASPVWMDIDPSDTLQYASAREHDDERHICPLQLRSYPARRGALDESRRHCSIAVRGDRQRRICDAANGAPVYWRRAEKQLLPASRAQSACGIADDATCSLKDDAIETDNSCQMGSIDIRSCAAIANAAPMVSRGSDSRNGNDGDLPRRARVGMGKGELR